jgi:hypothetical protein
MGEEQKRFDVSHDWPATPLPERKRQPKKDPKVLAAEARLKTLRRRELVSGAATVEKAPRRISTLLRPAATKAVHLVHDTVHASLVGIGKFYILGALGIGSVGASYQEWDWVKSWIPGFENDGGWKDGTVVVPAPRDE